MKTEVKSKRISGKKAAEQLIQLVKRHRAYKGWTMRELCRKTGFSVAYMSSLENNTTDTKVSSIIEILNTLEVPPEEILKAMTEDFSDLYKDLKKVECCHNCGFRTKGCPYPFLSRSDTRCSHYKEIIQDRR